tara:strand:+ start:1481 stop:1720 length:240 start_codon:yes stop_codon:yes gene_type:complete
MKKFFTTFIVLIFALFINLDHVFASTINLDDLNYFESPKSKNNDLEEKEVVKSPKSIEDIFGDEQTFPFVAGLGKNSAH